MPPAHEDRVERLWEHLLPGERVLAALDGAAHPELVERLTASGLELRGLLRAQLPPPLARVAPYLVDLEPRHPFCAWLLDACWGANAGVFLLGHATFKEAWRHLRTLLLVRAEDGRRFQLRWYDPRVLRAYLPTCTPAELAQVFGPLRALVAARDDAWLVHTRGADERLERRVVATPPDARARTTRLAPPGLAPAVSPIAAVLAEHYPSARAAEALWVAAGGAPGERPGDLSGSPEDRWQRLWTTAAAGQVRPEHLLREALRDFPRQPALLAEVALRAAPAEVEAARALVARLERLELGAGAGAEQVRAALGAQALGFEALVAALDGGLSPARRVALARGLEIARLEDEVRATLSALAEELRAATDEQAPALAASVDAALRRREAELRGSPVGDALAPVADLLATRRARLAARRAPGPGALRAAIASLQVSLRGGHTAPPSGPTSGPALIAATRDALRCTRAARPQPAQVHADAGRE